MALDYNTRSRNWFLCIQEGASCFASVPDICNKLQNCTYAYILHDAENYGLSNGETVEGKKVHYHVVLAFDNARTFGSVTKSFSGGHVEPSHCLADCCAYLLHATPDAVKAGKKQYDSSEITTNNPEAIKSWLGDKGLRFEIFNENRILEYIVFDGLRSISGFYFRFGAGIQRYVPLISALLADIKSNPDSQLEMLARVKDFGYNIYSDTFDSVSFVLNIGADSFKFIDLVIRYQKWEYLDDVGLAYIYSVRDDLVVRFKLLQYRGMSLDVVRAYLIDCRQNALF